MSPVFGTVNGRRHRSERVWERVPIAWLAGVRRVGKTTLARSFPPQNCRYLNCDSPRVLESLADLEFFFSRFRHPIVIQRGHPELETGVQRDGMA